MPTETNLTPQIDINKIVLAMPFHIYWIDRNNIVLGCNERQAAAVNLPINQIIGKHIRDLLPEKDVEAIIRVNNEVMSKDKEIIVEESYPFVNGTKFFLSHKVPLKNDEGEIIGLLGISANIKPQKIKEKNIIDVKNKIEQEKNEIQSYLDNILSCLPEHIYWMDKNGRILGCNDQQIESFGMRDKKELIGKNIYDVAALLKWHKDIPDTIRQNDLEIMKTGRSRITEEKVILNGEERIFLAHKKPLRDLNKKCIGILGTATDITKIKKMEVELKKAKELAEEASQLKSQFMADMQHDLRTPCSSISAITILLAQRETDPGKKEILQRIAQASTRLLKLLDNILAFGQIKPGMLPVIKNKFKIKQMIDEIFATQQSHIADKKTNLTITYNNNIPPIMIGDEQRIARVLLNIINNAIKFTPKGRVDVSAKISTIIDKRHALLQVSIKDNGIGIPKDKLHHIYERFVRVTPANKNKFKGTGLGLSVAKCFMDDLKGKIEVKSKLKKGTTFICTFPIELPPADNKIAANTKTISKNKQNLEILLAEDNVLAQITASAILKENFTGNVDVAASGKDAIKLARKNKYDVILTDIGLPDITGYETTQKIRKLKTSKNKKTIIIALTAHNTEQEKKNSLSSGMDAFLVKPLDIEKTEKILQKLLSHKYKKPSKKPKVKKTKKSGKTSTIDLNLGAQLIGKDKKAALEMLKMLVDGLPEDLKSIQSSFKTKDFAELAKVVHKLHGGLCYCGTPRLKDSAKKLESALKSSNKSMITKHYNGICKEITLVLNEYKKLN